MKNPRACRNSNCDIDYPHDHLKNPDHPEQWSASIGDPPITSPWPDRLAWKRPARGDQHHLFEYGWFRTHAGFQLPFKIDCETGLNDGDWHALARIVAGKFAFRSVYGVPKGGTTFARHLDQYCEPGYPVLIVDDVLTTGNSMVQARAYLNLLDEPVIGIVVFARGHCPDWVWPLMIVSEWAQSRGTGLG